MSRYLISGGASGSGFNASAKAPSDIETILVTKSGYTVVPIHYLDKKRGLRSILIPVLPLVSFFRIQRRSTVVFQYAPITCHKAYLLIIAVLMTLLRLKNVSAFAIVHDLTSMRDNILSRRREIRFLNLFDGIIAHSEVMKDMLVLYGYQGRISVLGLFDYLADTLNKENRSLSGSVNFSGNLKKSVFLNKLQQVATPSLSFELYGKEGTDVMCPYVRYNGAFDSSDLSNLKGSWGLVWDGDSTDRLEGVYGEYLKYNSPHKASMYLCAELPLIVPNDAAISTIVRNEDLGISVDSIADVPRILCTLDAERYRQICSNVRHYSERLRKGANILSCLDELEQKKMFS